MSGGDRTGKRFAIRDDDQLPAFLACLALGTLYAIQRRAIPSTCAIWSLGSPFFWEPLMEHGDIPQNILEVLQTADELSALQKLAPEAYDPALQDLIDRLIETLRQLPEQTWQLEVLDAASGKVSDE